MNKRILRGITDYFRFCNHRKRIKFDTQIAIILKHNPNYFKGEIGALVKICCREDMTCGDVDFRQIDYEIMIHRFIEQKHSAEDISPSQRKAFQFLQDDYVSKNKYLIECYYVYGDEPYQRIRIDSLKEHKISTATLQEFIDFIDMKISFNDLRVIDDYSWMYDEKQTGKWEDEYGNE
jgi:hypothetical protein